VGLLCERDLGWRIVVAGVDPRFARVADVMAPRPPGLPACARLDHAHAMMRERSMDHAVVVRRGEIAGILSAAMLEHALGRAGPLLRVTLPPGTIAPRSAS
jgi:CBS domain-containing protein